MKVINFFVVLSTLVLYVASEGTELLYKDTRICARHKSNLCLSYDSKKQLLVLGKTKKIKFEIETVERINMQLNRVYTTLKGSDQKSCLVRKVLDDGTFGVSLAPCDTNIEELVLAVELAPVDTDKQAKDEFVLKEVSYLDDGNTVSSPYCLTASHLVQENLTVVSNKHDFASGAPVVLSRCGIEGDAYGQEFRAKSFRKSLSNRMPKQAPEIKAEIGMFCLSSARDLCLGMSLTNGISLEGDKLVQVKNLTKNEAKKTHDLKMRWYHDFPNKRIATAANMDLCLEAIYDAPIGNNRKGTPQFDDVVHLGSCDGHSKSTGGLDGFEKSEKFYTYAVTTATTSYIEIRTDKPATALAPVETKCVSIVKCVKHDNDHCTPYNSVPVYDEDLLSQGAHARLKDCNSGEMVSQRFYYIKDDEVTVPPTKFPTPEPTTVIATETPTIGETPPVEVTAQPTFVVEPVAPTPDSTTDEGTNVLDETSRNNSDLLAMLALVGVFCLLIIILALAYYSKKRQELASVPEEDENFIARV